MSATNRGRKASGLDFYRTPAWCIEKILPELPLGGSILEPCAGDGAIIKAMIQAGVDSDIIDAIEIDGAHEKSLRALNVDFAIADSLAGCGMWAAPHGLVIMNPPFNKAEAFCRYAIAAQCKHRGTTAVLMRLAMLEGAKRVAFWAEHPADVFVLAKRPSFTGGGTDSCAYAWFVFGPGRGRRWQVLP